MDPCGARHRARCSRRLATVAVVVVVLLAVSAPASAGVGRSSQASAPPTLHLVEQAPWIPMGGDLVLDVDVDAPADAVVTMTVHTRVDDRAELIDLIGGAVPGTVLGRRRAPLGDLPRDRSGTREIRIGTQDPRAELDDDLVAFEQAGVYPVVVTVDDASGSASFVTFVTVVDPTAEVRPMPVALVVPVQAAPVTLPDGSADPYVLTEMRAGGRLARVAAELADSETPFSLAVGPETALSWGEAAASDGSLAAGLDALRAAADDPDHEVLATPYVRLDLPAITANGLAGEVPVQMQSGASALSDTLDVRVDPRQIVVDPADDASLEALADGLFVDRVVVPERAVSGAPDAAARQGSYRLDVTTDPVSPTSFTAALADPLFSTLAFVPGDTALRAQRFLAALAVDATIDPASRGAVVTFPHDWAPEEGFLTTVLAGLSDHPLLDAVTLGDWFDRVPRVTDEAGADLVVSALPIDTGTPAVTPEALATAREQLAGLRSLVGDDPSTRAGAAAILRAPSADFTGTTGAARVDADLTQIGDDAATFLAAISTDDKSVTITGDRATIPITLHNETGQPVRVRLSVASSKLLFPEGDERIVVLEDDVTTVPIAVEARASGTFPMTVTLTTADEVFAIGAPHTITVRTTIFSGVGGWLTAGAATFLGVWWLSHAVRSRRRRGVEAST